MRDVVEQLAQAIYWADVALAVESGHDCPYYLRSQPQLADEFKSFDGQAAIAETISLVTYKDLPPRLREEYGSIASTVIQGGVVASDWYERMGVKRPAVTLAHLRSKVGAAEEHEHHYTLRFNNEERQIQAVCKCGRVKESFTPEEGLNI